MRRVYRNAHIALISALFVAAIAVEAVALSATDPVGAGPENARVAQGLR